MRVSNNPSACTARHFSRAARCTSLKGSLEKERQENRLRIVASTPAEYNAGFIVPYIDDFSRSGSAGETYQALLGLLENFPIGRWQRAIKSTCPLKYPYLTARTTGPTGRNPSARANGPG
jgi:hypothetical protein